MASWWWDIPTDGFLVARYLALHGPDGADRRLRGSGWKGAGGDARQQRNVTDRHLGMGGVPPRHRVGRQCAGRR